MHTQRRFQDIQSFQHMVRTVRFPPPGLPLGSGQVHLLIRFWVGTADLLFVLSNKMPLARHCRALAWISNEEAGKAATSSHIKWLSGEDGGWGGGILLILLICMQRKQEGETKIDRGGKRGREMSIKETGQAEISTERRLPKINCWEKMQTKCFCSGERDRIRSDCSHTWNLLTMLQFHWYCRQEPVAICLSTEAQRLQSAGCFCCSTNKSCPFLPRIPLSEFGLSWSVMGLLAPTLRTLTGDATGDNYKWAPLS